MNELQDLQDWYGHQCNGDWEHSYGVCIETLDNPGWLLKIDVVGTPLETKPFEKVERPGELDWINCQRSETQFVAAGGSKMLPALISVFLDWARTFDQEPNNSLS
ncbi:MAG: immunity 53 family protein [Verrucomicrobiaceae bacterium]|nr:immunity 53 family protein [Verrucomicrobiaceae bacterium]